MAGRQPPPTPAYLGLPPLVGGHNEPPPPPPPPPRLPDLPFESVDLPLPAPGPHRGPSRRKAPARSDPPPPDATPWESAGREWVVATFHRRHALLLPLLHQYLERARCKSLESFLHAFYVKEKLSAVRGLGAAAEFLLMEAWRAHWVSREPHGSLPAERKAQRSLMDPLLRAAAEAVAKSPEQLHRESVEFCDAVVDHASRALRARKRSEEDDDAEQQDDAAASRALRGRAEEDEEGGGKRQCISTS